MEENRNCDRGYTIKDLPINERPREKLLKYGVGSLSNAELIAIIIRTGHLEDTAIDLANRLLSIDSTGIRYLSQASMEELTSIKGIGHCKSAQIIAAIELGKRISSYDGGAKLKVNSPHVVVELLMEEMRYLNKEHFKVILLNTKNHIISVEEISVGNLNSSIVHPREVFNVAIKRSANSMILAHNHPSGDSTPSTEDVNITHRLIDAGNIIGIKVLDHIIIGDNNYISFKQNNII